MTSDELAEAVAEAVEAVVDRVTGVGKEQYDDGSGVQKFESLDIDDLVKWTLEELDDLMVYNVMLRIRLTRIRDAVRKATVDAENKKAQLAQLAQRGQTEYFYYPTPHGSSYLKYYGSKN